MCVCLILLSSFSIRWFYAFFNFFTSNVMLFGGSFKNFLNGFHIRTHNRTQGKTSRFPAREKLHMAPSPLPSTWIYYRSNTKSKIGVLLKGQFFFFFKSSLNGGITFRENYCSVAGYRWVRWDIYEREIMLEESYLRFIRKIKIVAMVLRDWGTIRVIAVLKKQLQEKCGCTDKQGMKTFVRNGLSSRVCEL